VPPYCTVYMPDASGLIVFCLSPGYYCSHFAGTICDEFQFQNYIAGQVPLGSTFSFMCVY